MNARTDYDEGYAQAKHLAPTLGYYHGAVLYSVDRMLLQGTSAFWQGFLHSDLERLNEEH